MNDVYSTELVERGFSVISQALAKYFEDIKGENHLVRLWVAPQELIERARKNFRNAPKDFKSLNLESTLENLKLQASEFLNFQTRLHSPRYMGHQVAPSVFVAGLMDAVASVVNGPPGIFEMGAWPAVCERVLIEELGKYLGWEGQNFDGIITGGGSLANFTALLTARNVFFEGSWTHGVDAKLIPVIFASAESHYSVSRSAGMLGLGTDQVIKVPVDSKRKMNVEELRRLIPEVKARGFTPFCVVASSCATPTGSFDPIEEIASVSREYGLWLHVDAAHGGGFLLSPELRGRLKGIELADSVVWDAHKMMYVPALCTFVFYRKKEWSYLTFSQQAPYLFGEDSHQPLDFDSAARTVECTKHALAQGFWALWTSYGPSLISEMTEVVVARTQEFYDLLQAAPDFAPMHMPECNILCFEFRPGGEPLENQMSSQLHARIRKRLVEDGRFFVTGTRLGERTVFRVTLMNPKTSTQDLTRLLDHIRVLAKSV